MGPAIGKARAAQVAAMMVRIFTGFLLLPVGWSSFFIVSSRPCRPADYEYRTGQSRGRKSTWDPGSIMNTVSAARTHASAATAIANPLIAAQDEIFQSPVCIVSMEERNAARDGPRCHFINQSKLRRPRRDRAAR